MSRSDIEKIHWIDRFLPQTAQDYIYLARLDRPIGVWLLLLPGLWAIALAAGGALSFNLTDYKLLVLFTIGAVVMRAAGCVVNDLWDRHLDIKVERTKDRPIAAGRISVPQASIFLAVLLGIGALILSRLSLVAILLGFLVLPLIVLYPLMKRWTWWPQAFLGITFNFGALMGWAAVSGVLSFPALLLYVGGIFWTLGYDTIYALQDKEDDELIGIKSLARKLGDDCPHWIKGFYGASFICIAAAFFLANAGLFSYIALVLPALHLVYQITLLDIKDGDKALILFKANRDTGLLFLFAALV